MHMPISRIRILTPLRKLQTANNGQLGVCAPHLEGNLRLQRVWVRHLRHVGPGALPPGEHAQGLQVQGLTRPVKHQPVHVWGGEPMQQPCRLAQATHQLGLIVMRG